MSATAFFLPRDGAATGQRFCMLHEAQNVPARAAIVYVHPWAEEMNKARRMAALQARALAASGCTVLQIDLLGCGDSSGDFRDATWQAWIDDVGHACRWLRERIDAPLWLWGLRAGCLVAADAARTLDETPNFLFWQPVTAGKATLHQFLRLKTASNLLGGGAGAGTTDTRKLLEAGQTVEIAGYELNSSLAFSLEQAVLAPPAGNARLVWMEVSSREEPALSAASGPTLEHWRRAGYEVEAQVVRGSGFWQTVEIEDAPALIEATVSSVVATATA